MAESKVLYQDRRVKIWQADGIDEHHLTVDGDNGAYCPLQTGVLKDLARRENLQSFQFSLEAMNYPFVRKLTQIGMPLEHIAWSFSKARMKELENEAEYLRGEIRKLNPRD